jgi:hypothetical protein
MSVTAARQLRNSLGRTLKLRGTMLSTRITSSMHDFSSSGLDRAADSKFRQSLRHV